MAIWWFVAFVVLLVLELVTVNLVSIWFAIGAVAAIIATILTDSIMIQTIVFIVVSIIALAITKPLIQKFKGFEVTPTNSDRVIGKIGVVTRRIEANKYGEVKVYGNAWTATSDTPIEEGEKVKVLAIDGVKLIVKKEED